MSLVPCTCCSSDDAAPHARVTIAAHFAVVSSRFMISRNRTAVNTVFMQLTTWNCVELMRCMIRKIMLLLTKYTAAGTLN